MEKDNTYSRGVTVCQAWKFFDGCLGDEIIGEGQQRAIELDSGSVGHCYKM